MNYVHSLGSQIDNVFNWTKKERDLLDNYNLYNQKWRGLMDLNADHDKVVKRLTPLKLDKEYYSLNTWIWGIGHALRSSFLMPKDIWAHIRDKPSKAGDKKIVGAAFYPFIEVMQTCPPLANTT
jgi:hypothetical protein